MAEIHEGDLLANALPLKMSRYITNCRSWVDRVDNDCK